MKKRSRVLRKKKRSNPNQMQLWQGARSNETGELLAAPILRFQCLEQKEENREAQLHAHESGETWIGHRPEIVAVEQLPFLSVRREERLYSRSRTEVSDSRKAKTHPLHKPQRMRHPTSTAPTKGNAEASIVQENA
jgi:hypothetical protein